MGQYATILTKCGEVYAQLKQHETFLIELISTSPAFESFSNSLIVSSNSKGPSENFATSTFSKNNNEYESNTPYSGTDNTATSINPQTDDHEAKISTMLQSTAEENNKNLSASQDYLKLTQEKYNNPVDFQSVLDNHIKMVEYGKNSSSAIFKESLNKANELKNKTDELLSETLAALRTINKARLGADGQSEGLDEEIITSTPNENNTKDKLEITHSDSGMASLEELLSNIQSKFIDYSKSLEEVKKGYRMGSIIYQTAYDNIQRIKVLEGEIKNTRVITEKEENKEETQAEGMGEKIATPTFNNTSETNTVQPGINRTSMINKSQNDDHKDEIYDDENENSEDFSVDLAEDVSNFEIHNDSSVTEPVSEEVIIVGSETQPMTDFQ